MNLDIVIRTAQFPPAPDMARGEGGGESVLLHFAQSSLAYKSSSCETGGSLSQLTFVSMTGIFLVRV